MSSCCRRVSLFEGEERRTRGEGFEGKQRREREEYLYACFVKAAVCGVSNCGSGRCDGGCGISISST